uniref:Putative ribosomal-protein-alanine acetyltransferase n=1 Tax=Paulinella longichromatophora TaxID=1708747 RepID=A0A2H4ZQC9_9EUKA|nr:putative ribosomal-protein-alanine acetyltransferase [Paulinella longichromatophora]
MADICSPLIFAGPLCPEDLSHCMRLDRNNAFSSSWSKDQWEKELEDFMRPCIGIWKGQQLLAIACGWLIIDELHITNINVAEDSRLQGLGYQVASILLDYSRHRQAQYATLEVNTRNVAAIHLYSKLGFSTIGKRFHYYDDGNDAIIQWLRL